MTRKLFGTDGIRSCAGRYPLDAGTVLEIGQSIAAHFAAKKETQPLVVVGRDTRLSGDMIESALIAGLCSAGARVYSLGVIPTPGVAYWARAREASAGIMISASHNPFEDNGIKLLAGDGFKLNDEEEADIERRLDLLDVSDDQYTGASIGGRVEVSGATSAYLAFLRSTVPSSLNLSDMKIVVDAGHGAAGGLAAELFEPFGASPIEVGNCPDGRNINAGVGALHPEHLQSLVLKEQADFGIALDGDADRVIFVDDKGRICNGDVCLAICGEAWAREARLPGRTVVATQMSNLGLEKFLEARGIDLIRTKVGDRYVVEEMRSGGHPIGGEQSGHLIFLEHATTGDGLLTALQVLAVLKKYGVAMSTMTSELKVYPQLLVNVSVTQPRRPLEQLPGVSQAISRAEDVLGAEGRVLVRFSGTEPLARVMIEGREASQIQGLARNIADEIAAELG